MRVAHAPGLPGTFSPPPRVNDPDMHHGTCVAHVPWCMPGSLTSGFLWSRRRGKRSRHSRRMRNPQFYVSGERPIANALGLRLSSIHPSTCFCWCSLIAVAWPSQLMKSFKWPRFSWLCDEHLTMEYHQIAKFMGPTWGPPGSCRPRIDPILAPWTLLSGQLHVLIHWNIGTLYVDRSVSFCDQVCSLFGTESLPEAMLILVSTGPRINR